MPRLKPINFLIIFLFLLLANHTVHAQENRHDMELLRSRDFAVKRYDRHERPFLLAGTGNALIQYNPVTLTLGSLLYVYQNVVSYQFSASCLYSPSCSEFGKLSLREFGLIKGVFVTADRIMRCNRIAAMDIHNIDMDDHDHKVHEMPNLYKVRK